MILVVLPATIATTTHAKQLHENGFYLNILFKRLSILLAFRHQPYFIIIHAKALWTATKAV